MKQGSIKLFPNPAKNYTQLHISSNATEQTVIEIVDVLGRPQLQKNILILQGSNSIDLKVSGLSYGLYYVRVPLNGTILSEKLFIK